MNRVSILLLLCVCAIQTFAQEKKSDSISVRTEFSLPNPIKYDAYYDIASNMYYLYPKVGNMVTGNPVAMTPREYQDYVKTNQLSSYYRQKSDANNIVDRREVATDGKTGFIPTVRIKNKLFQTIFGGDKIEIIPQGFASFDLGILYQKIDNPLILPQNRTSFAINIQQRIQLGLLGKVGENLQLKANYDTQSGFAFENKLNLVYQAKGTWQDLQSKGLNDTTTGGEDKIIKRIEFGNVNLPLSTSLIRGSESLFGLKTEFQLGKTTGTLLLSQQQGEARNIVVQGGGVFNTFKLNAIDYEDNQHYYLGRYFLDNYDSALLNYPQVNSRVNITRIEAWVLDQGSGNLQEQKGLVGIRDLGEGASGLPDNSQNGLYQAISAAVGTPRDPATDYVNVLQGQSFPNASGTPETYTNGEQFIFNRKSRRLSSGEFTYNPQLGYLSLSQRLNDNQLLAVSYSYTINGDSRVYKVGEFSEDSPVLISKLLKPNNTFKTTSPMWDLMMKNIYPLNASQINPDGFIMNVFYRDPGTGGKVNYLPGTSVQDTNLLKLFNWDRLNLNNDLQQNGTDTGDGIFDFVPGITIDAENGKLIFTKAKPFGSYLSNVLGTIDTKYIFNDLYTEQKQRASQSSLALRYTMEGRYKGSQGSGISLGAINVPQGSVKVTANGVQLIEGQDYTVDYLLGSVNIINEAVKQSGQAINISLENQLTFNTQRKTFVGLNLERKFNDKLTLGATIVNYAEQPLTQKVNFGEEAVNNTMAGFNVLYNNQLPFLTRLTDKIPFINTEATSNVNFLAEGAYLIPGQNKGTDDQSYIDDFEQTTSKISLKEPGAWSIASKPELNQADPVFAGAGINNDIRNGFGRGLITWYNIDPRFYGIGGKAPNGINAQALSNHFSRRVQTSELFNNRDFVAGEQTFTNTFDVSFFPTERGPYNYNPSAENTQSRWGGLMRPISVSNFVNSNIEYVEFWLMDPYADNDSPAALGAAPKMLLQLGNVTEDVLKDGKLQYENGLPTPNIPANTTTTNLGIQPNQFPILYAFATEGAERTAQDLGYDGLDDISESEKYNFTAVNPVTNVNDPSSDNFLYYLSDQFQGTLAASLSDRYRYFRNPQGNSESASLEVSSQTPDAEDANGDYNLDQNENYNQYSVDLAKANLVVGKNNIVDMREVRAKFQNGQIGTNKWYLFRIPVAKYDAGIGSADLNVLNNVRFARMLLKGFDNKSTLRFGTFDLVRSDYRKYTNRIASSSVPSADEGTAPDPNQNDNFDVGSVNLEENSSGNPPYVLPPGIARQVLSGAAGSQRQNESSLYLKVTNLRDEARGVFKNTQLDMRRYKNLQLFVHAENLLEQTRSDVDEDAKFFIRFGSDATDNYYEYESSLKYTAQNATSPMDIWPTENEVNLEIQKFVEAKQKRDGISGANITARYTENNADDDKKIYVKGRPSLGNITTIMIGIRNEYGSIVERAPTAGVPKNLVLWVNELRLSGIDNKGGYAGNASLNFNLGDFATVNANAAFSTIGFGSIVEKPAERSQNDNSAFSINTTINVDKFLPEKIGMKIPVNYSYSQTIEDPKYNPLDNDIEFAKAVNKGELKKVARTYTQQRSIGVINMRKERVNTAAKPKFYDVENLSLTTIYNDDYYRDVYTKRNYRQYLRGYADYNYSFKPFVLRPFNKMISDTAKSYKYLRWVKEFNFNPVPTRVSFRAEVDRNYNELQFRNIDALISGIPGNDFDIIKNRNFYFGWQYGLGFNFTKSLKLEINSATRTLNDETSINNLNSSSIFSDPLRSGRPVLYNHRVQLNYRLPFEYLPYLDFINAEVGYGFQYNWNARSTVLLNSPDGSLGSIGQNTNNIVATSTVDVPRFFSKFKYFQKINTTVQKRRQEIDSLNNVYTQERLKKNSKFQFKSYKFKNKLSVPQSIAYALTSIKQLDVSYNENNGIVLPGLLSAPNGFGYGQTIGGPTYGFLLGSQSDIRRIAVERGWLSTSTFLNDPYTELNSKNLTANLQVMPINDLRIDFNILKNYNRNFTQGGFNVDANPNTSMFDFSYGNEFVSYSRTAWTFKTSFIDGNTIYNNLIANAQKISQTYGGTIGADGFAEGRSLANAYVLIPAFQNAVEGKNGTEQLGDAKKSGFPVPNWNIVYSGLKNIPFVNSQFSKFDILHSYNSTYTATGVQSNIDFYNVSNNGATTRDVFGDVYNPYTFSQVLYTEAFAPLIGADFTMRNNFQFRALYNRDRAFLLGLVNHTLTEDSGTEYVVGFGYILKDLKFKLNFKGKSRNIISDLNIRGDFALRDSKTRITNILENDSQVTGGQRLLSFRFAADYNMSQNFNLKFFYDQLMTRYKISTAFPLSTVRAGITATFTFSGAGN